jgi:hypothetical protein
MKDIAQSWYYLLQQFFISIDYSRDVAFSSLQGFGYGDVVHQFEKHCNRNLQKRGSRE